MLQSLRDKIQGWPAIIMFGLLSLLLAGWGVGNYVVSKRATWVAKIDGHEISQHDFREQMNNLRRNAAQKQGDDFDPARFRKPDVMNSVLDQMIDSYLLKQSGNDLGMVVTDADVRRKIASMSSFQVNGKFDPDAYKAVLANSRLSVDQFQNKVRSDIASRQLPRAIAATSPISDATVADYLKLQLQTRDLAWVTLPRPALQDTEVAEADIKSYYKAHKDEFVRPRQVSLNYIELSANHMDTGKPPTDEDLRARYQDEKSRFVEPEQRKVAHILVDVPDDADADAKQAALDKARKIEKKAKADKSDFDQLAKKYSDDAGSAASGGELGWLQKGVTGQAFEKAVFAMDKGEISDPIRTSDGYHVILLQNVRRGDAKSFDEVRDQLAEEVRKSQRATKYSKVAGKLTDEAYKNPSSLAPAAKAIDADIHSTEPFAQDGTDSGMAAHDKVVKAAFSDNVLEDGNNSDPISLGDDHIVVIRVKNDQPAKTRPLDAVSDRIRQKILDQRAQSRGQQQAEKLLAKVRKQGGLDAVDTDHQLHSRDGIKRQQRGLPDALLDKAFSLPHPDDDTPQYASVALGGGRFAVLALRHVHAGNADDIPKQQRQLLTRQMRQAYARTVSDAWVEDLKRNIDIQTSDERM